MDAFDIESPSTLPGSAGAEFVLFVVVVVVVVVVDDETVSFVENILQLTGPLHWIKMPNCAAAKGGFSFVFAFFVTIFKRLHGS